MSPQHLDALARDLESQGRFAEAESVRLRFVCVPVSAPVTDRLAQLGRAAREAEARGDWRRWAELLSRSPEVGQPA